MTKCYFSSIFQINDMDVAGYVLGIRIIRKSSKNLIFPEELYSKYFRAFLNGYSKTTATPFENGASYT